MNDDFLNTLDNLITDFMYNFDDLDLVCHLIDIDMRDVIRIRDDIRKHAMNNIYSADVKTILGLIEYSEKSGIPLRPTGLEIRTYLELRQTLAKICIE